MARTDSSAVGGIIELDATVDVAPFIETATLMVDDLVASDTNLGYSTTKLELIERWLSAHLYAVAVPRTANEKAGPVGEAKQYKLGLNLAVTMYGQQVLVMDTSGYFASLSKNASDGKRKTVGFIWAGTEDC